MDMSQIVDFSREALKMALLLGGPPLAVALLVGLVLGVGQTLTQMNEPIVAQIPRLIAVLVLVLVILPWLVGRWVSFAVQMFDAIPTFV